MFEGMISNNATQLTVDIRRNARVLNSLHVVMTVIWQTMYANYTCMEVTRKTSPKPRSRNLLDAQIQPFTTLRAQKGLFANRVDQDQIKVPDKRGIHTIFYYFSTKMSSLFSLKNVKKKQNLICCTKDTLVVVDGNYR